MRMAKTSKLERSSAAFPTQSPEERANKHNASGHFDVYISTFASHCDGVPQSRICGIKMSVTVIPLPQHRVQELRHNQIKTTIIVPSTRETLSGNSLSPPADFHSACRSLTRRALR